MLRLISGRRSGRDRTGCSVTGESTIVRPQEDADTQLVSTNKSRFSPKATTLHEFVWSTAVAGRPHTYFYQSVLF